MTDHMLSVRSPMLIAGARPPPPQSPEGAETGHTMTGGFCNQCSPEHTQCCSHNPTSPYLHERSPFRRHAHGSPHTHTRHHEHGLRYNGPKPFASKTELPQPRGQANDSAQHHIDDRSSTWLFPNLLHPCTPCHDLHSHQKQTVMARAPGGHPASLEIVRSMALASHSP